MNLKVKRDIIVALLKDDRPDLANVMAHVVTADHHFLGEDIWGKVAKIHVWRNALTLEEYPPGGKVRGKMARTLHFDWYTRDENIEQVNKMLDELATHVKAKAYEDVAALVKLWSERLGRDARQVTEGSQKAVRAPNPLEHAKAPKPFLNPHGVHVEFRTMDPYVSLRATRDQNNLPSAFTQGPMAYKAALKTFGDWKDLPYQQILQYWMKAGVKFHDYCAMD